jgi:uncharacterized membrane protein
MRKSTPEGKLAAAYRRFRTSNAFIVSLVTFIASWICLNFAVDFDPGWGGLNLFLSVEASVGMALIMMDGERQNRFQREQLQYMLHVMDAVYALLESHAKEERKKRPAE